MSGGPPQVQAVTDRMNSTGNRWLAIGVAIILFGAIDLVALFLTPSADRRGLNMIPPIAAAVVMLIVLPYVLALFQRQQDQIRLKDLHIQTLHAMDTAIISQGEIGDVLETAAMQVMKAVNGEAGGVVLYSVTDGEVPKDEFLTLADREGEDREKFADLARSGGRPCREWQGIVAPITAIEGENGWLVAARYRPAAPFDDDDQEVIDYLATTVGIAVSNSRRLEAVRHAVAVEAEAERVRAALERERRVAQALTEGLLPDVPPRIGSWGFSRRYVPQSDEAQVGGDIYDLFPLGEGRLAVVIADVSGKGLAAAKQTAMVKYSLRSYAREHESPARALSRLNDALTDDPGLTGFVTLLYGVLDDTTGRFTYASAGHEPPIVRRAAGSFETLSPTGIVLGAMRDMAYQDNEAVFAPGDAFLLYTDGLSEARNSRGGDFLGLEGIQEMLTEIGPYPAEEMADAILEAQGRYTGGRRSDDTAIVWVERLAE